MIEESRNIAESILDSLGKEKGQTSEDYLAFTQEVGIDFMFACQYSDAL